MIILTQQTTVAKNLVQINKYFEKKKKNGISTVFFKKIYFLINHGWIK